MKKFDKGLIVGKFYPFHKGHEYLIQEGLRKCKRLTVMVISNRFKENISAETRAAWISETFPGLEVRVVADIGYDDDSKKWADYTIKLLGSSPDVVITSEKYGITWAHELGCKHIMVDLARAKFPISGTKVRLNPVKHWSMLPAATKRYFAQRVVLIGAESTGKSTLAEELAKYFKTNWVHEYGRFYTELRKHNSETVASDELGIKLQWDERDFINIAKTQNLMVDQLAETANKVLICDTDSFATYIWHYRYMKKWSDTLYNISNHKEPLLYLVTPPDIPFSQDGTRDGRYIRNKMHTWVIEALKENGKNYHIVSGGTTMNARLEDAITAIKIAQQDWISNQGWREY